MNSFQLKRVLEEGLHHDHTTDGEYHNSEIKQSPNLLGTAGKRPRKAILPHRKLPPFGPPPLPSEFSLPSVRRVWLFSGTTQFMYYSRGK